MITEYDHDETNIEPDYLRVYLSYWLGAVQKQVNLCNPPPDGGFSYRLCCAVSI
jgi:hypothetical protein